MKKVVMVCLGNICRSPLAEGILRDKASKAGVDLEIDSAGTAAYHEGELPDRRSIAVAKKNGLDITNQRARQFKEEDLVYYDVIFAMDQSNYNNICRLTDNEVLKSKVDLILNKSYPNENIAVPDPYYGGDNGFDEVYSILDKACDVIINELI